jgi:hypothetical protein
MTEPTNTEPGPYFAPTVRSLLFLPLDSREFASALQAAGSEEKGFAQEILEYMIEKNLNRNAELQERKDELRKLMRFPGST